MTAKYIIAGVVAIVAAGGILGGYKYLFAPAPAAQQQVAGTSPTGATFSTAKFAGVAVNLGAPGANATSSSVFNSDANDRYITSLKVGCEGVGTSQTAYTGTGLSALTVFAATSSTAAPAVQTNTNKVGGGNITVGTSTPNFVESTSTANGGTNAVYNIWPAGTWLTFTTNATNTAVCTFGGGYTAS